VGLPAWVAATRLSLPFYNEVRGFWELSEEARDPEYRGTPSYNQAVTRDTFIAKNARCVFTLNTPMRRELEQRGIPPSKIFLIPNGANCRNDIRLRRAAMRSQLGIRTTDCVLGYIGSFSSYEGVEELIQACDHLSRRGKKLVLLLVGDDKPVCSYSYAKQAGDTLNEE